MRTYLFGFCVSCVLMLAAAVDISGCQALPAVVTDISNIAQIVIVDVEKGMAAPAIVADVIAQDGSATIDVILAVISSLLTDPKTPPADIVGLQSVHDEAMARKAASK